MELRVVAGAVAGQAAAIDAELTVVVRSRRFTRLGSTILRMLRRGDRTLLVLRPSVVAQTIDVDRAARTRAA